MFGFFSNNNNNNNNNNNQNKGNAKKQAPKKQALDEDDFEEIAPKVNKTTTKDRSVLDNEMTTSIADWQTIESSVVITKTKATTASSTSPQAAPIIIQTQKLEVKIDKTIPQTQTTVENNKIDNNTNTNHNKPNHIPIVETVSVKKEIVAEKEPIVEVETPVKENVVEKEEEEEPEWKKQLANRDKTPYAFATPSPPYTIHAQKDPSFVETSTTTITYTQTQSNKQPYTVSSSSNSNYVVTTSGTEYASPQSNKHDPPYSVAY